MYIKEIECSNYRSYGQHAVLYLHQGMNVIIGENNSGKSNIVKAIDVIFNKLRNHTQITSHQYVTDENGNIKFQIPSETPEISMDEYHDKNFELNLKLRINFGLEEKDSLSLSEFKNILRDTPAGRMHSAEDINSKFSDDVTEVEFTFEISRNQTHGTNSIKAFMIFKMKEETKSDPNRKLRIDRYLTNKFTFDKFTNLLKQLVIIFPEFRSKPRKGNVSDIISSPSGEDLALVLFNLKNHHDIQKQRKYQEVVDRFKDLFNIELKVSSGYLLEFVSGGTTLSVDGIGAGVIETLNILTHIIAEENKVFVIDEPETHLHPHGKRILKRLVRESSEKNQIIFITHSSEFVELNEIQKVSLVRLKSGESKICRFELNSDGNDFLKRTLARLSRAEQKEFFFAKKVVLVEGDTEFGAFPIFGHELGYDFDLNSISVIPVGSNYFVGFVRILQAFEVPFLIVCDKDVLMNIAGKIKGDGLEIKTSSLFYQFNELGLLTDIDKHRLDSLQQYIIQILPNKWKVSEEYHIFDNVMNMPNLPTEIRNEIQQLTTRRTIETYDESRSTEIQNLVYSLSTEYSIQVKILDTDFEGIFNGDQFSYLLQESKNLYGQNKVLRGIHLASKTPKDKIPSEINEVINILKTL